MKQTPCVATSRTVGCLDLTYVGWLALSSLGVFGFVTLAMLTGWTRHLDQSILDRLHELARSVKFLTAVVFGLTELGSSQVLVPVGAVTAAIAWRRCGWRIAAWCVLGALTCALANEGLKWSFSRPRPSWDEPVAEAGGLSYPSGHSMNSAYNYALLAVLLGRWAWGLAVVVVVLIGLSRAYLGVHYPSDIVAGWAMGLAWAMAFVGVYGWVRNRDSAEPSPPPGTIDP